MPAAASSGPASPRRSPAPAAQVTCCGLYPAFHNRRNWLFAGSVRGGQAAAVVYTLIECCRNASVDMVTYLADVLVRIGTHPDTRLEELLPANWRPATSASAPRAAAVLAPA